LQNARGAASERLTFGSGKKETRVRGRIDRIDAARVDDRPVALLSDQS